MNHVIYFSQSQSLLAKIDEYGKDLYVLIHLTNAQRFMVSVSRALGLEAWVQVMERCGMVTNKKIYVA